MVDKYVFNDGRVVQREYVGLTPSGNPIRGRWVLRDINGEWIDFHIHFNEILEHNDLDRKDIKRVIAEVGESGLTVNQLPYG